MENRVSLEKVKQALKNKKITQTALKSVLTDKNGKNLSQPAISKLLRGKTQINDERLTKIAELCGVEKESLYENKEEENPVVQAEAAEVRNNQEQ